MMLFKTHKKKAFSLTETIIMLTILAIAVASLTPMITKKLANNVEAGTTINGVSHGRYEIYAKEIVEFGSKAYEKSGRETKRAEASVLVFDRLDDLTYKKYASKSPEMNSKGQKSTLYEQIDNAKAYRSPSGDIEYVEFKKNGITKKYPVGGNIIVESSNVIYTEGKIIPGNPDSFEKKSGGIVLPNDNNRIIEGALTKKFNKKSDDNNILWHIDAKNDSEDNFEGTVTVIPWEKVISGNKIIVDKPIKKDPTTGEYIGTFDPGLGTKSLVLHAVGGGGAGGGLSNIGGAVTPKNATAEELKYMKEILAKRFREIATKNGLSHEANIPIDTLVRIERATGHLHDKQYDDVFTSDDNYIVLNTVDGTITVKADTRNGLIFPSDLLDYTNILGSQTQEIDLYDMPVWGDFETMYSGGDRGKPFYAGGTGCGQAGGAGATYAIDSMNVDFEDKADVYCKTFEELFDGLWCCNNTLPDTCVSCAIADGGKEYCGSPYACCKAESKTKYKKCTCICEGSYYEAPAEHIHAECHGNYGACSREKCWRGHCPGLKMGVSCQHEMRGGSGGAQPPCATACTRVSAPIGTIIVDCGSGGATGRANPEVAYLENSDDVVLQYGQAGGSCYIFAGTDMAISQGGGGGSPCPKDSYLVELDMSNTGSPLMDELGKQVKENISKGMSEPQAYESALNDIGAKIAASEVMGYLKVAESAPPEVQERMYRQMNQVATGAFLNAILAQGAISQLVNSERAGMATMTMLTKNPLIATDSKGRAVIRGSDMTLLGKILDTGILHKSTLFQAKSDYTVDYVMASQAPECGSSFKCGKDGASGTVTSNDCPDTKGICTTRECNGDIFNHIYSWTMPFAINQLHYGEAGQPGEYKTTKIAETTGPFTIILGLGGVWTDHKDTINGKWAKDAKKGLNGTDTIIKMKDRNVLTAKGGKGGTQSLSTHRYDLCYAKKDECKRTDASVTCCDNEIGKRSTKEIFTTASKMSAFENIKALTGNSTIIGIGLGRGGEGAGTRAGVEQLKGLRVFRNASGYDVSYSDSQIKKEEGTYKADLANLDAFKNYALAPSGLNFKGGDGAVIITW